MHPACVATLNCALMLHPPCYTRRLCLVILLHVSVRCQRSNTESGYHEVELSPVCRARKENFATCDRNVKLSPVSVSIVEFLTIFRAPYCRSGGGNLKHIYLYTGIDH